MHTRLVKHLTLLLAGLLAGALGAAERPNILWITSEDNAANWLGCYGNKEAHTPRLDALAAEGLRFTRAYSNAAVCAVARSTILNGAYAVSQGTQHMRSRHPIPARYKPYVACLREAGYYCTNNSKTDYNFKGDDRAIWDECSGKAHYKNRPAGKPFFAIFNLTISHESSLFPAKVRASRKRGEIPPQPRIDPAMVTVPPHLPDLPEMRLDIAIYHDVITALDKQVGELLDELSQAGLADDTIVFYYADHGGITPRGKRYLKDTGMRVPMIVRVPEKWRSMSRFAAGQTVDECVAFVDLAPTLLSLIGLERPPQMQGRAFLGLKRVEPAGDAMVFLFADRFDEIYGMRRGLTDGRWKYIRRFTPHLPAAPYSEYQFGQPAWSAWRQAWRDGKLDGRFKSLWEPEQPVEELFDTQADPWELQNLAGEPAHAGRLATMRARLKETMAATRDTGLIPEPMFAELARGRPVADFAAGTSIDLPGTLDLAFTASARDADHLPVLRQALGSPDPLMRYWAAHGCLILGKQAGPAAEDLQQLLADPQSAIRTSAAFALARLGRRNQAIDALVAELDKAPNQHAALLVVNTLTHLGAETEVPKAWIRKTLANKQSGEYLRRFAERLSKHRK